jgi:hypothetical protein
LRRGVFAMEESPGKRTVSLSVMEFLTWVSLRQRTYGEAMESWRSTCPRLSTWEDALADGLIQVGSGATMDQCKVTLTARGHALLDGKA